MLFICCNEVYFSEVMTVEKPFKIQEQIKFWKPDQSYCGRGWYSYPPLLIIIDNKYQINPIYKENILCYNNQLFIHGVNTKINLQEVIPIFYLEGLTDFSQRYVLIVNNNTWFQELCYMDCNTKLSDQMESLICFNLNINTEESMALVQLLKGKKAMLIDCYLDIKAREILINNGITIEYSGQPFTEYQNKYQEFMQYLFHNKLISEDTCVFTKDIMNEVIYHLNKLEYKDKIAYEIYKQLIILKEIAQKSNNHIDKEIFNDFSERIQNATEQHAQLVYNQLSEEDNIYYKLQKSNIDKVSKSQKLSKNIQYQRKNSTSSLNKKTSQNNSQYIYILLIIFGIVVALVILSVFFIKQFRKK